MDIFAAIADPVRRRLVLTLATGPRTAGELAEACPTISRPAVSRHLRVLREAGLAAAEPTGRERHYSLDPAPLQQISQWIATAQGQVWEQRLDAFETEVHRTRRERRTATATTPDHASTTRSTG